DCVTVYSMLDRRLPMRGTVDSIGWGVLDQDRINLPRSVPYVERSLNWVRVAQRFPVRIRLESPPSQVMRLGASAVIEVKHGRQSRGAAARRANDLAASARARLRTSGICHPVGADLRADDLGDADLPDTGSRTGRVHSLLLQPAGADGESHS